MKHSIFIGRWQPFHDGHKRLIDTVLKEGKNVLVAIRDTPKSKDNPYSVAERRAMIKSVYGSKVKTMTIPDIEEVCYGRKVGYDVREINLDEQTKGISATNIRKGKIFWLTGNSGAGKTTLSMMIKDVIHLDGDDMRRVWNLGFSKKDRWEQNMRVARLAKVLRDQGYTVVVSTICPFKELRDEIRKLTGCKFVYLEGGKESSKEYPYEVLS